MKSLYALLLAVQTAGALIILWKGIPIYRQIVADASQHEPQTGTFLWTLAAVALIQTAYWLRLRLHPTLPKGSNALLGHVLPFLARLSLIFTTSSFSVIFFAQPKGLNLPPSRFPALVAVLFSMFCYSQELERLGKAMSPNT